MILTIVLLAGCSCGSAAGAKDGSDDMSGKADRIVNKTVGARRWFPGNGQELKKIVDGYINSAVVPDVPGRIVGAIAPHAGYIYSGKVAGYTFRALKDNAARYGAPDLVVILGFSHSQSFEGVALLAGDAIKSPLGEADLDVEIGKMLVGRSTRIFFDSLVHEGEHSAENEIPFVQESLPGVKLVVGLIGDHDPLTLKETVSALVDLSKQKKIVVVASTDMLHDADYDLVSKTDRDTLKLLSVLDADGIAKRWSYSQQVFCGIAPVLTVMQFARSLGCAEGDIIHYRNSGDDFPESKGNWVVGYGAAVFSIGAGL